MKPGQPNLPEISEPQTLKLRQLTLVTLSLTPQTLTYDHLISALSLPTSRALEDLVISSIYAGLLIAKLDTISQRVDVFSVAPLRDLKPESVPALSHVLEDWDRRCVTVLGEIEGQVREVRRKALETKRRKGANEKAIAKAMGDKETRASGKRVQGEGEEMDVDEGIAGRTRNAKRGGGIFRGLGRKSG